MVKSTCSGLPRLGHVVQVERGDLEHRARPFAVAGRDDRRVDVEEALFLEEVVDRAADAVPHAGDRAEGVGPRAQVGDRAQELEGVPLLLERIGLGVGPAVDGDARAWTSVACPLPGEAFTSPSTVTLHPAVSRLTSDS